MFDSRSQFSDPFTIRQLLEDLDKPKYDYDLSMTTTMKEFKVFLLKHSEFKDYHALVQCPTFGQKWHREAVDNLRQHMEQTGSYLQHFSNFPKKPPKNDDNVIIYAEEWKHYVYDYEQYGRKLRELRDKEKHRLSREEKTYLSYEISTFKTTVSGMRECLPFLLPGGNKRKAPFEDAPSDSANQPSATRACMDHLLNGKMMAIDFFILAYPEMTLKEACKQFSLLDLEDRAVFDRQDESMNHPLLDKQKIRAVDFFKLANPQVTDQDLYKEFSLLNPKDRAVFDRQEESIKKIVDNL